MTDGKHGGAADAETLGIGASAAPGRERRMTAGRKREAVLRLLRGEPLEIVARELAVMAADLSGCLVSEHSWDRVRWAIEDCAWRFDGLPRRVPHPGRT